MSTAIPCTLNDTLPALRAMLGDAYCSRLADSEEESVVTHLHHTVGRKIRNQWGLWTKDTPLYKNLAALGLWHADDMSGLILRCFHRWLRQQPLDVEGQVKHFLDYWKEMGHAGSGNG